MNFNAIIINRFSVKISAAFLILFSSCSIFPTNTIREKKNRCFIFDVKSKTIVRKCLVLDYDIVSVLFIEKDTLTMKNITSTQIDNITDFFQEGKMSVREAITDSMKHHTIRILLQTKRDKTYYSVDIQPSDWKSGIPVKHFIKNEW